MPQLRIPKVLLFDVNETLLDLAPVRRKINGILKTEQGAQAWFYSLLHHSLVVSAAGEYRDFSEIGAAVLQMLARNSDISLSDEDAKSALKGMRTLDPHQDVVRGLQRLKAAGFRMVTLTNSSQAAVAAQIAHAGLKAYFERELSVEGPHLYKPHRAVYQWAAKELGVDAADCMLVAAHGWDVAGAKWAGMQAAFVAREGQQKFPLAPAPDLDVADLEALATALGT